MDHTGQLESLYADHLAPTLDELLPEGVEGGDEEGKREERRSRAWTDPGFLGFGIPFERLKGLKFLAQGGSCRIYRGKLTSADEGIGNHDRHVVLKVPRDDLSEAATESAIRDLDLELNILQIVHHPNIVRLIGAGLTPDGHTFMLTEDLSGGTLAAFLGTDKVGAGTPRWLFRRLYMSWTEALAAGASAASAVAYLHDRAIPGTRVLHRDIKSANLAFSSHDRTTLKLFDFGLARILRSRDRAGGAASEAALTADDVYKMTGGTGSLRYMAPEVAMERPYNEKADVYSFSIVLWELLAVRQPYENYTPALIMERVVNGSDRPRVEAGWPPELRQLLTSMWDADFRKRPPMHEVVETIQSLALAARSGR